MRNAMRAHRAAALCRPPSLAAGTCLARRHACRGAARPSPPLLSLFGLSAARARQRNAAPPPPLPSAADGPRGVAPSDWDPDAAAKKLFQTGAPPTLIRLSPDASAGAFLLQLGMAQCLVLATVCSKELLGPLSTVKLVSCPLIMLASASLVAVSYRQLQRLVVHLRILPAADDTPEGAVLIAWCIRGPLTLELKQYEVKLENLAELGVSRDGRWRTLRFRRHGRSECLYLSSCDDAAAAAPFIVSMRRHLEAIRPELRPMRVALVQSLPLDPTKIVWAPTRFDIPDPRMDAPAPRVDELFETAERPETYHKGGDVSAS